MSEEEARGYGFPPIPWEYVTHCLLPYGQRDIAMVRGGGGDGLCMVDVGRSTDGLQSNQKYFPLPFLHIWYLPCAPSSEGADWTYVWVEVFLLQPWDGLK